MRKITFLLFAFVIASNSQTTLIFNTDDVIVGTAECNSGDNNWARNFILDDFSVPTNFELTHGSFGVWNTHLTVDQVVVVNVYASDAGFPVSFGSATLLGTQNVVVPVNTVSAIINFTFDSAIAVPNGTTALMIEVHSDAGQFFSIGKTSDSTGENWLRSDICAFPDYVTALSLFSGIDQHFYISVIGDQVLATDVDINLAKLTTIYPNPLTNVLKVDIPSNIEIVNATLYDILGKDTSLKLIEGEMNTSNLSSGIYILNIKTIYGSFAKKIIKK
jgi:hypothetical protein